jgi:hypothetical protein
VGLNVVRALCELVLPAECDGYERVEGTASPNVNSRVGLSPRTT